MHRPQPWSGCPWPSSKAIKVADRVRATFAEAVAISMEPAARK